MDYQPLPAHIGIGVSSFSRVEKLARLGFEERQVGIYWNYLFTKNAWELPANSEKTYGYIIDGFSPNLNKELHIGHLRNLALAKSLSKLFPGSRMVAMLGAAVGIDPGAERKLNEWFDFVDYHPEIYYDDRLILPESVVLEPGSGDQEGCLVWEGPNGPVIVQRSNGKRTYAYHDLAFTNTVHPTHYVTGEEQLDHFKSLGLGDKHLGMGLVLGALGKKMSSRSGHDMSAREALDCLIERIKETPEPTKLAWNIFAWNFLKANREKNITFIPEQWTKPEHPGMYISYTYARVASALGDAQGSREEISDNDVKLLGFASYKDHYLERARTFTSPAYVANYAHELATVITGAYCRERIADGRPGFQFAVRRAHRVLGECMDVLGMNLLQRV